ncbi:unnamed protein product [Adineta steineri]|uniref:Uncharacterized protein n=1 Tax=Adineta steineri TaxID=433720 RepID=A0A814K0C6_9BILA|nr:unnamed protein product [Adineta steineri]
MATNLSTDNTNLGVFTIVWVDAYVNKSDNKNIQDDLRQLTNQLKTFENNEQCELYIESALNDECIILIASGKLGRQLVPRIHDNEKISSIYIYCFDKEANKEWAQDYTKIQGVITRRKELIEQICINNKKELVEQIHIDNKKEIYEINDELFYIDIYTNDPNDEFINSQLLINYLVKLKIDLTIDREQFFSFYKTKSTEDNLQLANFEEFQQNYSFENCLFWLTKDKSLQKLLLDTLYTKNIDLLYLFRFFIQDINEQLELHRCLTPINVYHHHLITNEQIEQLQNSVKKLISINTFFLTTFEREKALTALQQTSNLQKILFEIHADPSIEGVKPFADITSFSSSKKQSQILFMLGSIFRIEDLYQQGEFWICEMKLASKNDLDLQIAFEKNQEEDGDCENDILSFGNFLARIGRYDDAEKYYKRILNELTSNDKDTHICYHNLGNLAFLKNDYNESIEYHLKSLEISEHLLPNDHPNIADSYNCLGIVYFNIQNYEQALIFYKKALDILKLTLDENYTKVITCLNNISLVYRTEKDYVQALSYHQEILDIEKKYLSEDHMNLGSTYHNIGALLWCIGKCDDAMKNYKLSYENKTKFLPCNHSSIAMTLENIGLINEYQTNYQQALDYFEKAQNIYQGNSLLLHSDVIQIQDSILRIKTYLNLK